MKKNNILWIVSLAVTGVLLFFIFRRIELDNVLFYWEEAAPFPLLLILPISFITNCLLAAWKWKYILGRLGLTLSGGEALLVKMGGLPLKSLLPFRSGEATRVVYLKRRYGFSAVKSAGSVIIELFFNIIAYVLIIIGGCLFLNVNPRGLLYAAFIFLGAGALFALLITLPSSRALGGRLLAAIPSLRLRGGLKTLFRLHRFFSLRQILTTAGFSLLIQAGKILSFYLIMLSLDLSLPPRAYFIFLPLSILIATVPVTFLGIGLREGSLTTLLVDFCAAPAAGVLGGAFLFSLGEYIFPMLLGLFWTGPFTARIFRKNQTINAAE